MTIARLLAVAAPLAAAAAVSAAPKPPAAPKKPAAPPAKPAAKPAARPSPKPMAFRPTELDLAPGETFPVELLVTSPTGSAVTGSLSYSPASGVTVHPDTRFTGRVPAWGVKTYPKVTASRDAADGAVPVRAALDRGGEATLTVKVARPAVEVVPGDARLTVKVTNPFAARPLTGRVLASNPDRFLQDVTTREFKIAPGQTQEIIFPLPGAAPAETESYDFTITVETYQGYREKKTHSLRFPPQAEKP